MKPDTRFTAKERAQLIGISELIDLTDDHLKRAEALPLEQLPDLTSYERSCFDDYRSQLRALGTHYRKLVDLRLEKSPEAARIARGITSGLELLHAMQRELGRIIDKRRQLGPDDESDDALYI